MGVLTDSWATEAAMDLERRLGECAEEFVTRLTDGAGFTREEATDFAESAVLALMESYAWQANALEAAGLDSLSGVRWLLAGVRAKALASRSGLSPQRTWDGLRAMAPVILRVVDAGLVDVDEPKRGAGLSGIVHPIFGPHLRMRDLHHT